MKMFRLFAQSASTEHKI